MSDWVATQRKYWDTWSELAKKAGAGAIGGGNGEAAGGNPFAAMNPFASNPFAKAAFSENPFAQNPFAKMNLTENPLANAAFKQNPFANAAFTGNPFANKAFAQNPFANNPFTRFSESNPFEGMVERWWSTIKPEAQGDIGTVAQRFFDMGKSFMSMADGVFTSAGHEHPDAAMQMWMSGMQAALQQWIAQVQNNMDIGTPDLPGISGTTLSTWAQVADTVAPWLNMSQEYLRDIAEGHLPGGIQMPGVGAAQEQFCRALSMPGLGYTREQQERLQELAQHLLGYHDSLRAYKIAFGKTALSSLDAVQKRLKDLHEKGEAIDSLRALYDMWVDASEDAYAKFAMSDEYQVVYGDLVNSLMRVRQDMNDLSEQQYRLMNIPTRSEIDTMQKRQQQLRRENRQLRHEFEALRASVAKATVPRAPAAEKAPAPAAKAKASSRKAAPKQDPLPIDDVEDDLTAIKGIGPKMMEKLYAQGIKNFARLAEMNNKLAGELDETLKAQGRVLRDDWVGQAKKLRG
ncbi:MAG: class III poly(R)-hydroxyalkanoic acid synthase subunit PhaE [Gammaproteobacteria bacterium]|nr:class III poly(R)-hydroxyalkanoic acid synthase subunit PhaE [Gammaproteobacteria bacterium]